MVQAKNSCHKWLSCMLGMPTVRTLVGFLPPCCVGLCPPRIWFANSFLECSGLTSTAIVHLGNSYDPICRETVRVWNYTRMSIFFAARTFPIACRCRRGQTEAGQFAMSGDWKRSCTNHVCVCLCAVLLCKLSAPQTGRLQACKPNLHGLTCIIAPCVHLYDAVPSAEKCHVRCPAPSHI